jgi:hypothetical protein
VKDETPEQAAARRAADAERKRRERAAKKETKAKEATEKELAEAASFPEYWERQRANLTAEQQAKYQEREESGLDVQHYMRLYVEDRYQFESEDTHVTLDEVKQAVAEEIAAHGVCEAIILVVDRLWTEEEKDLRERIIRKGGPTVDLLNYGYRTGLDSFLHERFRQKFLVTRTIIPSNYVTMKCTSCNSPTGIESVPVSIADSYTRLYKKFECSACRAKEAASRATSRAEIGKTTLYQSPNSHVLFDSFGRLRDQ